MKELAQQRVKDRILKELAIHPIVETACKKANVSRATYYRWLEEDPEFEAESEMALARGRDRINDIAESQLMRGINDGQFRFVKYWLSHNHRNYVAQKPVYRPYWKEAGTSILSWVRHDRIW